MTVGLHTVTVSADRSADAWGAAKNANPLLTVDAAGWTLGVGAYWETGAVVGTYLTSQANTPYAGQRVRLRAVVTVETGTPDVRLNALTPLQPKGKLWAKLSPGTYTLTMEADGAASDGATVKAQLTASTAVRTSSLELFLYSASQAPVDVSCLTDQVSIHHGREDPTGQPEASTCSLEMSWDGDVDTLPDVVEMGAVVTVRTQLPAVGSDYTRFTGRITDLELTWVEAGDQTPSRPGARIICAGFSADLGRRVVGDAPFPQELDGARVSRIFNLAGVPLDPFTSDPGTVQILPRDVDSQPALEVAAATAGSAAGVVWYTRDGQVRYADADHRRGIATTLSLDACDVLASPQWRRTTEGLVNKVSIGYGPTPEEGEQPRYLTEDAASITRYGEYELTDTTELATLADAQARGTLVIARNASPVWVMAALPVDLVGLDDSRSSALLALDMHSLLELTGLPAAGSAPTSAALWLEGWNETLAWGVHEIELFVSGYCRTAPPPRWDDMAPDQSWDATEGVWDDMKCAGPAVSYGRWNDTPASLRWDTVPAATTWDTWK